MPYYEEEEFVRKQTILRRIARPRQLFTASVRRLTPREREVLKWISYGKSNAEIGEILGISAATVSKHLERIYPKLGVENRTAAASFFR
jgi:RNA polymerase sigma factor (sigma-70 family)